MIAVQLAKMATDDAPAWVSSIAAIASAVFAIVLGIAGVLNARWVAKKTGENSDAALARTLEADRQARVTERRLELYADILTYVAQRRQFRDVHLALVKFDGVQHLDAYEANDVFGLAGRAEALAAEPVLQAFIESNTADQDVINQKILSELPAFKASPVPGIYDKIQAMREVANASDGELKDAIRAALRKQSAD